MNKILATQAWNYPVFILAVIHFVTMFLMVAKIGDPYMICYTCGSVLVALVKREYEGLKHDEEQREKLAALGLRLRSR